MMIDNEPLYPIVVHILTRASALDGRTGASDHGINGALDARLFSSSHFFFTSEVDVLVLRAEIHTRRYTTRFSLYTP